MRNSNNSVDKILPDWDSPARREKSGWLPPSLFLLGGSSVLYFVQYYRGLVHTKGQLAARTRMNMIRVAQYVLVSRRDLHSLQRLFFFFFFILPCLAKQISSFLSRMLPPRHVIAVYPLRTRRYVHNTTLRQGLKRDMHRYTPR